MFCENHRRVVRRIPSQADGAPASYRPSRKTGSARPYFFGCLHAMYASSGFLVFFRVVEIKNETQPPAISVVFVSFASRSGNAEARRVVKVNERHSAVRTVLKTVSLQEFLFLRRRPRGGESKRQTSDRLLFLVGKFQDRRRRGPSSRGRRHSSSRNGRTLSRRIPRHDGADKERAGGKRTAGPQDRPPRPFCLRHDCSRASDQGR